MTVTSLNFILYSLAVWRLSSLFANEDGPFYIFKKLRAICEQLSENNFFCKLFGLYQGLQCEWCNSIWFAFPIAWLLFDVSLFNSFIIPLAASTVVIIIKCSLEKITK